MQLPKKPHSPQSYKKKTDFKRKSTGQRVNKTTSQRDNESTSQRVNEKSKYRDFEISREPRLSS